MGLWETCFVLVAMSAMFIGLFKEIYPSEIVVFSTLIAIWLVGIIDTKDALSGYSNTGMLAVGALFVAVKGIEKCQLVDRVARKVFGVNTSMRFGLLRMMTMTYFLSAFLNNTPIVAALIPVTRDWARMRGFAPSTFLMPLSFSCILGGMLTTIGTSTNLVVNGLLDENDIEKVQFLEPGYASLPIGLISILYLSFFAPLILPKTFGLFHEVRDRTDELITEIQVESDCGFVGKSVASVMAKLNMPVDSVIKIRRVNKSDSINFGDDGDVEKEDNAKYWGGEVEMRAREKSIESVIPSLNFEDVYPVQPLERIEAGDILFLGCAKSTMIQFNSERIVSPVKGLRILDVGALDLPGRGTQFFELVLGGGNKFIGSLVSNIRHDFFEYYGANVIALRKKRGIGHSDAPVEVPDSPMRVQRVNSRTPHSQADCETPAANQFIQAPTYEENVEVSNQRVEAGDLVLVLAKDEFIEKWKSFTGTLHSDFFLISSVGRIPEPVRPIDYIPIFGFLVMLLAVLIFPDDVDMVQAAMTLSVFLIIFGFIDAKEAPQYVDWSLLLLIGSALGISKAIEKSGLATYVADFIADSGVSETVSLLFILVFCVLMTELVTNNAAAALCVPLAIKIAESLNVSVKPFVMVIMMSASASFCTPIGYQTNTMVWAPGGYKFQDFIKLGFPLTLTVGFFGIFLVPIIFPF